MPVTLFVALAGVILAAPPAAAKEYHVGEPVVQNDMQIVPHYLLGIEMAPMPEGSADKRGLLRVVDAELLSETLGSASIAGRGGGEARACGRDQLRSRHDVSCPPYRSRTVSEDTPPSVDRCASFKTQSPSD